MINRILDDIVKEVYEFSNMTNEELRCKFFQKLEECIDFCNSSAEIVDWLKNEGLKNEVNEKLELWKDNGTLEDIISNFMYLKLKKELSAEINNINFTIKSFSNLPVITQGNMIIEAKNSKGFNILLPENIPQTSIISIYFSEPVENGLIYDYRIINENVLCIRFTNVTDNSISLSDKEISLKVIY